MVTVFQQPISLYLSYAQKDEVLKEEFEDYLIIMQQSGLISGWAERPVQRGTDWSQVIDPRLLVADLVLLFMSPGMLASGYCSGAEVHAAFGRREKRELLLVPIILQRVNLTGHPPFDSIQPLPMNGIPIASVPDRSNVWGDIDREIRHVIKDMAQRY